MFCINFSRPSDNTYAQGSLKSFDTLVSYNSAQSAKEREEVLMYDTSEVAKLTIDNHMLTVEEMTAAHNEMWMRQSLDYAQKVVNLHI